MIIAALIIAICSFTISIITLVIVAFRYQELQESILETEKYATARSNESNIAMGELHHMAITSSKNQVTALLELQKKFEEFRKPYFPNVQPLKDRINQIDED